MDDELAGKTCLVTGASRGIGRACAIFLAKEGCPVAVNYREREEGAAETCRIIEEAGGLALPFRADVSRASEVEALVASVKETLGPIYILVNNAGIAPMRSPDELTEEIWDETITVNLKSAFLMTQAVLSDMRTAGWGRIINVSSNAAFTGGRVGPHYASSKAGMNGLTHSYSSFYAKEGLTVNSLAPAGVMTEMVANDLKVKAPYTPVPRFGHVDEVAEAAVMFARCGYISGQTLLINGGLHMS